MQKDTPIILIGMMLAGKTTIGRLLATDLRTTFIDLDDAIVAATGQSIPSLFGRGEAVFREAEEKTALGLLNRREHGVVALGGGSFESASVRQASLRTGFVVYLYAPAAILAERYQAGTGRPLLDEADSVEGALGSLLKKRSENYRRAHLIVDTKRRNPRALAEEISHVYRVQNSG